MMLPSYKLHQARESVLTRVRWQELLDALGGEVVHRAKEEVREEPYLSYYKYMNVNILIRALVKLLIIW